MPSISPLDSHNFSDQDRFFFDANIWLFTDCAYASSYFDKPEQKRRKEIYSQALKDIIGRDIPIFIDILIVSEFINAYARLIWKRENPGMKFKKFRQSQGFQMCTGGIVRDTEAVIERCSFVESESKLGKADIQSLLNTFSSGSMDFNDKIIEDVCRKNGFLLVTDDGDFKNSEITVLTANKKLLG